MTESRRDAERDPIICRARVSYTIPLRQSEVLAWSTPGMVSDDPDDDAWMFEVEGAVADRLPDLLDRAAPPDVEVD